MKKLFIVLSVILCLSLLGGCTDNATVSPGEVSSDPKSEIVTTTVTEQEAVTTTTGSETTTTSATDTIKTVTENDKVETTETKATVTTNVKVTTTTQKTTVTTTAKPTTTTSAKPVVTTIAKPTTTTTTATTAAPQVPKYITGIAIDTMPAKTTYITGDKLDTTGLVLTRQYSDGSSDTVKDGFTAMGFDSKKPGKQTVTIVYKQGGSTLTCTFDVKVEKKQHGTPNISGTYHHDMENEALKLVNKARKDAGLNELKMDTGHLMDAADIRAKEITIDWAHERPDHDRWETVYDEEEADYNARGENLAKGHTSAEEVFKAWMDSPSHRANIMESRFTHVAIACFEYDGHFYWVQLFGSNI